MLQVRRRATLSLLRRAWSKAWLDIRMSKSPDGFAAAEIGAAAAAVSQQIHFSRRDPSPSRCHLARKMKLLQLLVGGASACEAEVGMFDVGMSEESLSCRLNG